MRGALFIGLRRINGTLTTFLGLLTDFKRKLNPLGVPFKSPARRPAGFEIRR